MNISVLTQEQVHRRASNAKLSLCAFWCCFLLFGCASVKYEPVKDDAKACGLRYYDSAPYVLMVKDSNSNWTSQLVYLPDQTRENQVKVWAFLSQNNSSFTFGTNGILTDASSTLDTTVIPNAVLTAIGGLASKGVIPFSLTRPSGAPPSLEKDDVALFKIGPNWEVIGATASAPAK